MKHKMCKAQSILLCTIIFLLRLNNIQAQTKDYIQQDVIKVAGITDNSQINNLAVTEKVSSRQYFDGLGRPIQSIQIKGSPLQHDIIQNFVYSKTGQQTRQYLAYTGSNNNGDFVNNSISEQGAFFNNGLSDKIADDVAPYKENLFEDSPLGRLLQSGSLGTGFQPGEHYSSISYRSNDATETIIKWSNDGINLGNYAINTLSVTQQIDEQGNKLLVYKDNRGSLILKRKVLNELINGVNEPFLDTYYVYNQAGLLSLILPPKAISTMRIASNWDLTQASVAKLLFSFSYDSMGRLIKKTVPGASAIQIIYDPLNRPVLYQSGLMRSKNQWMYVKYDVKGRQISQGIYTDAVNTTANAMQAYVSGLDYSVYYEDRSSSSSAGYYTNNVFPKLNIGDLFYSYYDNYDINYDNLPDYSYSSQALPNEGTSTGYTRGMLLATRKKVIGSGFSNYWLINVVFYDKKGNVIQVKNNNHLTPSVSDIKTSVPDFIGKPTQVKSVKVVNSISTSVLSMYTYDHSGRLKSIDQSYNGAASLRISAYEYNELGQLVRRDLKAISNAATIAADLILGTPESITSGTRSLVAKNSITITPDFTASLGSDFSAKVTPQSESGYLQSIDYRYNIRGALTSINNSSLTVDDKNADNNDIFGMELMYDKVDASLGNVAYYSGLVSAVKWMVKSTNSNERSYKFDYDNQNRLKNAVYNDRATGASTWGRTGAFDEKGINYDQNGNILTLKRNALLANAISSVDDLQYSYDGNQLNNVADGIGGNYATVGFKNATGSSSVYTYDVDGNLTVDPKKGMALSYNDIGKNDK
ncbi:MAG: repeat-associated core domain protein, partial [Daejeonella sp.]|nr:repeat-associated core domain protein [Daejeonella sp.]